MAIDTSVPRSRRALLAGGIGGLAALVASALGRPLPASAGSDGDVVLGATNNAGTPTIIQNLENDSKVLDCYSDKGDAIQAWTHGVGKAAIHAHSEAGDGVYGVSTAVGKSGVYGSSNQAGAYGVFGRNSTNPAAPTTGYLGGNGIGACGQVDSSGIGVRGKSPLGYGVYGTSASGIGVRGGSTSYFGVHGTSGTSDGINGYSDSGNGVYGRSPGGTGVRGIATSGTGLYGNATTGYALRAIGRVKLDKCAGVATIAATKSSVVVTPGIDLVNTSAVVATLQGNAGSATTTVSRCIVNATTNSFTIYLTKAATQTVPVAWIVLG